MVAVFLNDLRLLLRDRWTVFYTLAAPVVIITIVVAARYGVDERPRLPLPIVDLDGGPVAATYIELLGKNAQPLPMGRPEAVHMVQVQNRAPVAIVIPEGFSESYRRGEPTTWEFLTDTARPNDIRAIEVLLMVAEKDFEALEDPFAEERIALAERTLTGDEVGVKSYEQNVPGFTVMFVLLAAAAGLSLSMHAERDQGTVERLLVAPGGFSWFLLGKLGARFVVGVVQLLLLLLWGHLVFGISLGSSPWAFPVLSVAIVFATVAMGFLVASLATSREQTLILSLAFVLAFSALGGLWWPEQMEPPWMRRLSPLVFTTWAMRGLTDIILRDRGLLEIARPIGMLFAQGVVMLLAALWIFRTRYAAR
jgi:ABC-type multidrug transport system permease subunit